MDKREIIHQICEDDVTSPARIQMTLVEGDRIGHPVAGGRFYSEDIQLAGVIMSMDSTLATVIYMIEVQS